MPYKDKEAQKEANRLANQRYRKGITQGITKEGITEQGITQYHPLLYALTDPVKRNKLERIYQSLRDCRQDGNVYFGHPYAGLSFTTVGEMLDATR